MASERELRRKGKKLLYAGQVQEFNELRSRHPDWKPDFRDIIFIGHVYGGDLSGINLSEANLSRSVLSEIKFINANFSRARLNWTFLCEADLSGADLTNANALGVCFAKANLSGADLTGADLEMADLSRADLRGASLVGVNLHNADLPGANLEGANTENANFLGAKLEGVIGYRSKEAAYMRSRKITGSKERKATRLTRRAADMARRRNRLATYSYEIRDWMFEIEMWAEKERERVNKLYSEYLEKHRDIRDRIEGWEFELSHTDNESRIRKIEREIGELEIELGELEDNIPRCDLESIPVPYDWEVVEVDWNTYSIQTVYDEECIGTIEEAWNGEYDIVITWYV